MMLAALGLKPLDRKLLRDLWRLRGHVVAVALVAACGTASLVTMFGAYRALVVAPARYYDGYLFADVFASAKRAPQPVLERVRTVPGVAVAYDRVLHQVTLDVPGLDEPATGRLISIPETPQDVLNGVHLRSGRYIEPGARDEVLVSESFAKANGQRPGDAIAAVINGAGSGCRRRDRDFA
jgi:putative ABC transport system permease protein